MSPTIAVNTSRHPMVQRAERILGATATGVAPGALEAWRVVVEGRLARNPTFRIAFTGNGTTCDDALDRLEDALVALLEPAEPDVDRAAAALLDAAARDDVGLIVNAASAPLLAKAALRAGVNAPAVDGEHP